MTNAKRLPEVFRVVPPECSTRLTFDLIIQVTDWPNGFQAVFDSPGIGMGCTEKSHSNIAISFRGYCCTTSRIHNNTCFSQAAHMCIVLIK